MKAPRPLRYNKELDERKLEIDKNIPIPIMPPNNRRRLSKLRQTMESMEVGDSLLVRGVGQYSRVNSMRSRIKLATGAEFFVKKMSDTTYRIWRIK